jgi:hypothetical protein
MGFSTNVRRYGYLRISIRWTNLKYNLNNEVQHGHECKKWLGYMKESINHSTEWRHWKFQDAGARNQLRENISINRACKHWPTEQRWHNIHHKNELLLTRKTRRITASASLLYPTSNWALIEIMANTERDNTHSSWSQPRMKMVWSYDKLEP